MKKILFILITFIAILMGSTTNTYAKSSTFYEGEYIDDIYINKQKANSSTIYYQKARFFRQTGTNDFAYCIDPFVFFENGSIYEETITPSNLTKEQQEQISLIAYFGYGYKNHTDTKWYAITQFMIWQIADPTGNFYFTDGLNGPKIEKFTQEMNEINQLISNYKKEPTIANQTYTIIEGNDLIIEDTNNVLSEYKSTNPKFEIQGNKIIAKNLTSGSYKIDLIKSEKNYNKPILFYQSKTSQALMETGDLNDKITKFQVEVVNTEIEVEKLDKDTNSKIASGQGSLIGAIYGLYNLDGQEIAKITIKDNCLGKIENIPFGKYYLQEIKAPLGYQLDKEKHYIEISKEHSKIKLSVFDEIIKKKIIIYKTYDENNKKPEQNIRFSIYDKNNNLVTTITTDENGKAEVTLPYGEYRIVQENSTEGYHKVENINLSVTDTKDEIITLTDYKIKVPNTKSNIITYILNIILKLLNI